MALPAHDDIQRYGADDEPYVHHRQGGEGLQTHGDQVKGEAPGYAEKAQHGPVNQARLLHFWALDTAIRRAKLTGKGHPLIQFVPYLPELPMIAPLSFFCGTG